MHTSFSKFTDRLGAVVLLLVSTVPAARAAALDAATLTPSGINTNFQVTGTYIPGTPVTPFSSPNTPYSLTFALPTVPSVFAFVDVDSGVFGLDTTATLNSVTFPNSQIIFFPDALVGGFVLCLGSGCQPDPNTPPYPSANSFDVATGNQLFSGSVPNPTFLSGVFEGQSTYSFAAPIPEPTSLALFGTGMLGLGVFARRKLQRK